MNIPTRVRPLALGALAMLALIGTSVPTAAHAKPKVDPGIEMDCLLDGEWYDAGTELQVTYTDEFGVGHTLTIVCNANDGRWYSVRVSPTGKQSLLFNPNLLGGGAVRKIGP